MECNIKDLNYDENGEIFKYKFSLDRFEQRKKEQFKYLFKKEIPNYYSTKMTIEYYLNLDNDYKLSSGEYLIILLQLWRIHARKLKEKNESLKNPLRIKLRILLLDEPDAHMHPSLIKEFIDLLNSDDLSYLKLQVILSTHSPATVSLIPTENIFELKYDSGKLSMT